MPTTLISIPEFAPITNVVTDFNGTSDYIITNPANNIPKDQLTISFWIKTSMASGGTPFSYTAFDGIKTIFIRDVSNLDISINNSDTSPTGVSFNDGYWHYFTMTWEASTGNILIYKNAKQVFSGILALGSSVLGNGSLVMGQSQGIVGGNFSDPFDGEIGHLRIWDKVRSPFFIEQDMMRTLNGNQEQIVWQQPDIGIQISYISIASDTIAMATNAANEILFSSDYGQTWAQPNSGARLKQVSIIPTIAMGVNSNDQIYTSIDKGVSWTQVSPNGRLSQVSIVSGLAMGINSSNQVYSSLNNGVNWTQPNTAALLIQICVVSQSLIYGVGTDNKLYTSIDKGVSWSNIATTPALLFSQVSSYNGTTIIGITQEGDLYQSNDSGVNWTKLLTNIAMKYNYVELFENVLWVVDTANQLLMAEFDTQLILHWKFDEGYGEVSFDASGNKNNGLFGGLSGQAEPTWIISTRLLPPKFIDANIAQGPIWGEEEGEEKPLTTIPIKADTVEEQAVAVASKKKIATKKQKTRKSTSTTKPRKSGPKK